jgi:hypothetical protein
MTQLNGYGHRVRGLTAHPLDIAPPKALNRKVPDHVIAAAPATTLAKKERQCSKCGKALAASVTQCPCAVAKTLPPPTPKPTDTPRFISWWGWVLLLLVAIALIGLAAACFRSASTTPPLSLWREGNDAASSVSSVENGALQDEFDEFMRARPRVGVDFAGVRP